MYMNIYDNASTAKPVREPYQLISKITDLLSTE